MEWVKHCRLRLRDLLRRRGWKRQELDDVIQEAFLRMQIYCSQGGEVRNREAFLVRTTLNLAINQRTRDKSHLHVEEAPEHVQVLLDCAPPPEDVLAAEERLRRITARIDAMTPRTREIFLMHYIDDYSYPQIARQLGVSVSAIEKHMARAMLALTEGAG